MAWLTLSTTGTLEPSLGLSTDGILSGAAAGIAVVELSDPVLGDDGGWDLTLTGIFPAWVGMYIDVLDTHGSPDFTGTRRCYSGVGGQGAVCWSTGTTLACVIPPLPIGSHAYDVRVTTTDGVFTFTLADSLTIVHRSFSNRLFSTRSAFPPPRDVGPYSIDGED